MRQFITQNEWLEIPGYVREHIVQISGFTLIDQTNIHEKFSIGLLLELINRHIESDFHIIKIEHSGGVWKIHAFSYSTEDRELLTALFKAFTWCYDDKKRKKEQEEQEKKWRSNDKKLVNERYIG